MPKKKIKDLTKIEIEKACEKYDRCLSCPYCGGGKYYYCETKKGIEELEEIIKRAKEEITQLKAQLEVEIEVEENE